MRWLLRMTRKFLGVQPPQVTPEQAIQIALEELAHRGGELRRSSRFQPRGPRAKEGLRVWRVWLDPDFLPPRIVEIDNQTGQVRRYFAPPR